MIFTNFFTKPIFLDVINCIINDYTIFSHFAHIWLSKKHDCLTENRLNNHKTKNHIKLPLHQCPIFHAPYHTLWEQFSSFPLITTYHLVSIFCSMKCHNIFLSNPLNCLFPFNYILLISLPELTSIPWLYPCKRTHCKTCPIHSSLSFTSSVINLTYSLARKLSYSFMKI